MEAELCACLQSISLAIQRSDLPILLEMVSSQVMNMLKVDAVDRLVFASLVAEVKKLAFPGEQRYGSYYYMVVLSGPLNRADRAFSAH